MFAICPSFASLFRGSFATLLRSRWAASSDSRCFFPLLSHGSMMFHGFSSVFSASNAERSASGSEEKQDMLGAGPVPEMAPAAEKPGGLGSSSFF